MRTIEIIAAGGMLAGIALFMAQPAPAQSGQGHEMGMGHEGMQQGSMAGMHQATGKAPAMPGIHGGEIAEAAHHPFEALFTADGIRLYVYGDDQKPVDALKDAKATVTLTAKDGETHTIALNLLSPDEKAGRTQPCFAAPYDFSGMKPGTMTASFEVQGLTGKPITFDAPVSMMRETLYTCTMDTDVVTEDPGSCPKCGMDLVPRDDETGNTMEMKGSGR